MKGSSDGGAGGGPGGMSRSNRRLTAVDEHHRLLRAFDPCGGERGGSGGDQFAGDGPKLWSVAPGVELDLSAALDQFEVGNVRRRGLQHARMGLCQGELRALDYVLNPDRMEAELKAQ